jgi:hypothetical protein
LSKKDTRKYPKPSNIFSARKKGKCMNVSCLCNAQMNEKFLTDCSDEPIYLFNSSGPLTEMNRKEQAAAAALTM